MRFWHKYRGVFSMYAMSKPNKRQKMEGLGSHSISDKIFVPTSQDFALIRLTAGFVDHTPLIQLFFGSGKKFKPVKLFVSAPSHFCKSTNMNMIRLYFGTKKNASEVEKTKETFKGLKIMDNPLALDHICAHPVVFVDFKVVSIEGYSLALSHCFEQIRGAYLEHQHFLQQHLPDGDDKKKCQQWWDAATFIDLGADCKSLDDREVLNQAEYRVKSGLKTLCEILFKAHGNKRVLVLVDESDAFVTASLGRPSGSESGESTELPKKVAELMDEVLGQVSKGDIDEMLQGLLLTGISYIRGIGHSTMIKTTACRFLCDKPGVDENPLIRDLIVQNYGLYEDHLFDLLTKLDQKGMLSAPIDKIAKVIKENYNGYYSQKGQCVFSLWSVMVYLTTGTTERPMEMGYVGRCYKKAFLDVEVGRCILQLIANQDVTMEFINKVTLEQLTYLQNVGVDDLVYKNILLSLLMEVGFLTNTQKRAHTSPGQMSVRLPNEEIRWVFLAMIITYDISVGQFDKCYVKKCSEIVGQLRNTCLLDDDSRFKSHLKSFYWNLVEFFKGFARYDKKKLNECGLQSLMWFALTYSREFKPIPEYITVGNGQADLWLKYYKREFYIVLELKVLKGRLKEYSSLYALQQIKDKVGTKIDYTKELQGKNYLLIGLNMDDNLAPSMCVETSKSRTRILISKTEQDLPFFHDYYKSCYDLFREQVVA